MLIAIEGIDGSGKNTLAHGLATELSKTRRVKVVSSPGYDRTECGRLIGRYLSGNFDLGSDNPYAVALLFALDRQEGQQELKKWLADGFIVIADRYAPSNAAYQSARASAASAEEVLDYIIDLEYVRLNTIIPAHNIFLDTDVHVAKRLVAMKSKRVYTEDTFDKYESDLDLMKKVSGQYRSLMSRETYGRWHHLETCIGDKLRDGSDLVSEALKKLAI